MDKRKRKTGETLLDACANGDGTYNGVKLISRLSSILNRGRGLSEAEVRKIWDDRSAQVRAQAAVDKQLKGR
jgi:hypothetical protein